MKRVPLTVYENGKRRIIGEAYVEVIDGLISIDANVDEPAYAEKLGTHSIRGISMGGLD